MRRRLRLLAPAAVLGLLATTLVTSAGPAQAAVVQYGRVVFVADGDTIDVDVAGDGTHRPRRIRYIGIQATELHRYSHKLSRIRGECWSVAATRHLHSLIDGERVQLTARRASSSAGARPRRSVAVRQDGVWRDTGGLQLDAGLALPDLIPTEHRPNHGYLSRAQAAAAAGAGMWGDPRRCGEGPSQATPIRVTVHWDASGNDSRNKNGEWVDVTNLGTAPLDLGRWRVRDAAYRGFKARGYVFPAGTVVQPGSRVRLHVGSGPTTVRHQHWGLDAPAFANATDGPRWMGDGAWLFDPHGDLRAWDMYPCRAGC